MRDRGFCDQGEVHVWTLPWSCASMGPPFSQWNAGCRGRFQRTLSGGPHPIPSRWSRKDAAALGRVTPGERVRCPGAVPRHCGPCFWQLGSYALKPRGDPMSSASRGHWSQQG
ncbi:uncharacterized protein LOC144577582 [Callithrix jacchus]